MHMNHMNPVEQVGFMGVLDKSHWTPLPSPLALVFRLPNFNYLTQMVWKPSPLCCALNNDEVNKDLTVFYAGSYENEDPLRKRRPPTKTKTPYENEDPSRKRRHITKTSSKEVGTTFVEKDYVHETHYENEDPSFS